MKIRTTVVCLPVRNIEKTFMFYKNALGFFEANIEESMIVLELPNLSLFLIEKDIFETYTKKACRKAQFSDNGACIVISCAMETKEEVDIILESVPKYEGTVSNNASVDSISGGYTGYFCDPDGHLWELVYPMQ